MGNPTKTLRQHHYRLSYALAGSKPRPVVILVAGMHGDEPEGPLLAQKMARIYRQDGDRLWHHTEDDGFDLVVFGCVNPWGLAHGERRMEDGRDANRSVGGPLNPSLPFEPELWEILAAAPVALVLDLHSHLRPSVQILIDSERARTIGQRFDYEKLLDPKAGSLAFVVDANGYGGITVEVTRGEPLGPAPLHILNGASNWCALAAWKLANQPIIAPENTSAMIQAR